MRPPSVDALARALATGGASLPHPLLVDVAREAVAAGDPESAARRAAEVSLALLQPVVNATGVLLHTNLGRAPVAYTQPAQYQNVELDLGSGRRGSRSAHAGSLVARACGAEAALVVNNGAAALLLVLAALASGAGVIVSRGELIEIGGGFRLPEVLEASGASLVEVGTTNRTRASDYARAISAEPSATLVLKVHPSNFRISGFAESAEVSELAPLGVPVVVDIGSGLLDAACPWVPGGPPAWLSGEPAARQTLDAGAALVTFSGDKLLGGPQAGIIAGRRDLVDRCARHQLARALRPGGLVLGALQDTALAYLRRDAAETVPLWRMATAPLGALRQRAEAIGAGEVVECDSVPGGGSLPGIVIPSAGVSVGGDHTAALRRAVPPVIARVEEGRTICDLRSVDPIDDLHLGEALRDVGGE